MKYICIIFILTLMTVHSTQSQYGWYKQSPSGTHQFSDIFFLDKTTGWVISYENMKWNLFSTTDAGKSWQKTQTDISPVKIYFKDRNNGYAASSGSYKGAQKNNVFHKTIDGGKTWQHIDIPNTTTNATNTHDMFFKGNMGWICGGINDQSGMTHKVQITMTNDGGINWEYIEIEKIGDATSIFFSDNKNGWFSTQWGCIYKSANGGADWTKQYEDKNKNPMTCIYFINSSTGWAGGAGGVIYYTDNGGSSWDKITTSINAVINEIFFVNSSIGWAATAKGIYYTTDGGNKWSAQEIEGGSTGVGSLSIIDNKNGWTFSNNDVYNTNSGGDKVTRIMAKITFSGEPVICDGDSLMLTADPIETGYTYKWSTGATTPSIYVKQSAKYTVMIKAPDNNSDSAFIDVLVRTKPEITIVGDTELCHGTSGTISVKEKYYTYNWSTNESKQQTTIYSPGDYFVEVTDSNGCTNKLYFKIIDKGVPSLIKDITAIKVDSIAINSVRDSILNFKNNTGNDFRITGLAIKYDTNIFKINLYGKVLPIIIPKGKDLIFGVSFTPKEVRKYIDSLNISSDLPCQSELRIQLIGEGLTNTDVDEKFKTIEDFYILPNPVSDFLIITSNQEIGKIEIFSALGLKVHESEWSERIDVSGLSSGVFIIRIGNKTYKFIKL